MKIPGYGRLAQMFAKQRSKEQKKTFQAALPNLIKELSLNVVGRVDVDVVSFSGIGTKLDQFYSLVSFYYNVGMPNSWTIYSDGTLSGDVIAEFSSIPNLTVLDWNKNLRQGHFTEKLLPFSETNVWGKRLIAYINHPFNKKTIFTDSDILFYRPFSEFILELKTKNWFIADTGPHFEKEYLSANQNLQMPFVNAGFLVITSIPNWQAAVSFIVDRPKTSTWEHFTEQTSVHIMLHSDAQSAVLDSKKYILNCSDSFKFGFDYDYNFIALRHFVGPVRHKMWQFDWRRVLRYIK